MDSRNTETPRPCAIFGCVAEAAPGSLYCPPHTALQDAAEAKALDQILRGRRRRHPAKRRAGDPHASAWLPLPGTDDAG